MGLVDWLRARLRRRRRRFLVGVSGLILDADGRVLLLRHTYRDEPWGVPGGFMCAGEAPGDTLAREVAEETGLVVAPGPALDVQLRGRRGAALDIILAGRLVGGSFRPSAEVDAMRWVAPSELSGELAGFRPLAEAAHLRLDGPDAGAREEAQ
jgi:ADP-ribose pyrophosphatase YjhB (NUDIX family)